MTFGTVFSVTGVSYLLLSLFLVAIAGYLLGRVRVKGVSLGAAGVFITALLFGAFFYPSLAGQLTGEAGSYAGSALKIVENVGLVLFVLSVGFIAGPSFFSSLRQNYKSYLPSPACCASWPSAAIPAWRWASSRALLPAPLASPPPRRPCPPSTGTPPGPRRRRTW